jgi:hypothetical protein
MLRGGRNDRFQNAVSISQHIGIPEAEYPITFRLQPSISFDVACVLRVLPAIHFDDQLSLVANKVDDEATDRSLPPEAQSIQAVSAQRRPKTMLRIGHVAA